MWGKINSHICLMLSVYEVFIKWSNMGGKETIKSVATVSAEFFFLPLLNDFWLDKLQDLTGLEI